MPVDKDEGFLILLDFRLNFFMDIGVPGWVFQTQFLIVIGLSEMV
jgi:hypothetical protein